MIRGGRKIRFRPPKIRFHSNTKLSTNTTGKSHRTGWQNKNETALSLISPKHQNPRAPAPIGGPLAGGLAMAMVAAPRASNDRESTYPASQSSCTPKYYSRSSTVL
jgi:hypothetical protein